MSIIETASLSWMGCLLGLLLICSSGAFHVGISRGFRYQNTYSMAGVPAQLVSAEPEEQPCFPGLCFDIAAVSFCRGAPLSPWLSSSDRGQGCSRWVPQHVRQDPPGWAGVAAFLGSQACSPADPLPCAPDGHSPSSQVEADPAASLSHAQGVHTPLQCGFSRTPAAQKHQKATSV